MQWTRLLKQGFAFYYIKHFERF